MFMTLKLFYPTSTRDDLSLVYRWSFTSL